MAFAQQCGLTLCYVIMCAFSKSVHIRNGNELQFNSIKLILVSSAGISLSFVSTEALICTPLTTFKRKCYLCYVTANSINNSQVDPYYQGSITDNKVFGLQPLLTALFEDFLNVLYTHPSKLFLFGLLLEVAFRSPLGEVSFRQHQYKLFVMFSFILFLLLSCAFWFSLCLQDILLTSWLKSSFPIKRVWPDFHIWNLQNHIKYLKKYLLWNIN